MGLETFMQHFGFKDLKELQEKLENINPNCRWQTGWGMQVLIIIFLKMETK